MSLAMTIICTEDRIQKAKVMMTTTTQIAMPFHPFLKTITESLGYPAPIYQLLEEATNNMVVHILTDVGPIAYTYIGGATATVGDSCEKAAHRAVLALVKKFDIYVEDITSIKLKEIDRCTSLYKMKYTELRHIERGNPTTVTAPTSLKEKPHYSKFLSVDFVAAMRVTFTHFVIRSTTLETIEQGPSRFTAWVTLNMPGDSSGSKTLFGDCCPCRQSAKQDLAQKVLEYLMPLLNFEIVDVNFKPEKTRYYAMLCALQRENYLTLKERVLGIKEEIEPSLLLVEHDCLTARNTAFQVPSMVEPPLPPKKRKISSSVIRASNDAPLFFPAPPKLETVFKRNKFA